MYTNIEFLDAEPIENVITCMHHKMDKVIFFGYEEAIDKYQTRTEDFLKGHCDVQEVKFCAIDEQDLNEVIKEIKKEIDAEDKLGNKVYFDITGGESLFLVAFGMLSDKLEKPMHMYDVKTDKLIHLGQAYDDNIEKVEKNDIKLNLPTYIELSGAKIDDTKQSHINVEDAAFMAKVESLWNILLKYKNQWNSFSAVLKDDLSKENSLDATNIISQTKKVKLNQFHNFMNELIELGVITHYHSKPLMRNEMGWIIEAQVSISYADFAWKECLTKAGTTLELYVYKQLKDAGKEVLQSVHIDWDGDINENINNVETDVLNEIDVLMLEGTVPTFISCKCGDMGQGKALQPMYELETVASRFGGKYAKKVLATLQEVRGTYAMRAEEMNIQLDCYGK